MGTEVAGTVVLAVGRLAPGATLDAARAEFFSIVSRLQPGWKLTGATAETLTTAVVGNFRPILVAITSAVGLLLLIACVNIGTLFLVRAAARTRELAVRRALGASYWDTVRPLIVESGLLAVAGGALGVTCAAVMLRGFVAFAPPKMPHLDDVRLHSSLLGAAIGVTSIAVLLFGVVPALVAAQATAETSLRWDARSGRETRQRRTVRQWLVASQVALALVMLSGAGLLARSLLGLERLRLGYQTAHLSILSLALDVSKYDSSAAIDPVIEQVEARIRAIPGVSAVTPILMPPFLGTNVWHPPFEAEGESAVPSGTYPDFPIEIAGPQYFRAFEIPIIRGRSFAESDGENAPPVVVVSQSVAQRFWPGQDPIGKRIRLPRASLGPGTVVRASDEPYLVWRTVVGVVPDTRFRTLRESSPMVYYPWQQYQSWQGIIAVRSTGDARGVAAAVQNTVKAIDPTIAVYGVRSMDELLGVPLAEPRLTALLLTSFGAVALLLAAVGLFGAMSSAVREQTREIGIRVALGATPAMIRGSVVRRAFVVISTGMAVGLAVALATTRVLGSLLYQVSPADPITLAFVCVVLLVVAGVAAYLPARRATRIDPIVALRAD
jgi:putative ABC transport system permease protein